MQCVVAAAVLFFAFGTTTEVSSAQQQLETQSFNTPQAKWIAKSLSEMQTIKVGMTRAQLLKVFTTEGGISTREARTYVYRKCPYIKINVTFRPVKASGQEEVRESSRDVITGISQLFLQWFIGR